MIGVITGDIIGSKFLKDKQRLSSVIEEILGLCKENGIIDGYHIYRGDSFQMYTQKPEGCIFCSLLVRAGLRAATKTLDLGHQSLPTGYVLDARLAIGIGDQGFLADDVSKSNGQAFELSGRLLDQMTHKNIHLDISTCWPNINSDLKISIYLVDTLVDKWTASSAEVLFIDLLYKKTQVEISKELGISQPAVHKRMVIAHRDLIIQYIDYFHNKISQLLKPE
jgi:hypothetical protein